MTKQYPPRCNVLSVVYVRTKPEFDAAAPQSMKNASSVPTLRTFIQWLPFAARQTLLDSSPRLGGRIAEGYGVGAATRAPPYARYEARP